MIICKRCNSQEIHRNGIVRNKQRYKCKSCSYNFVLNDGRINPETAIKRAFTVIMYSLGKCSYGFIGKLFGVSRTTIQNWLEQEADLLKEPIIADNLSEIEFDEMWHFINSKKTNVGLSKHMIDTQARLSLGLQAIVTLLLSEDFIKRYSI
ncbi:transposase domain protein [Francisella sp. TX07-6608]|nr:transposase domain protein [Francisella sp. TX07-6608]